MLICLDQRTGTGCGARNREGAQYCHQCGKPLRFALQLCDPGALVGHYRINGVLGHGGFGAVYEADDANRAGLPVALKETFDSDSIHSFQGEFAVLSKLQHPHLPRYFEMFEVDGNGYLAMELVPGQTLEDVLTKQGGPLLESQVLGYALQICDALTYLHTQSPPIIHRDIKPANIRLTPEGLIKLVDFGLLKLGTAQTQSSRRGLTPTYAPMEQWSGGTDPRADIFSLGATLYHLLTNQTAPIATDRLAGVSDPIVSPRCLNSNLSPHVAEAVVRAMALFPKDRYSDVNAFKLSLLGIDLSVSAVVPMPTVLRPPASPAKHMTLPSSPAQAPEIPATSHPSGLTLIQRVPTFVVCADGTAQYRTITEALKQTPLSARILVRPGTYHEGLVLDRPVELIGDAPVADVVIESTSACCIRAKSKQGVVRGLTLRNRGGVAYGVKSAAVDIAKGDLLLEDCDITSDSLACLMIHGAQGRPIVRRCRIHDGKESGVFIYGESQAVIEHCEVFGNSGSGLAIWNRGNPAVRQCQIHDGQEGISVYGFGRGLVVDCDIWRHAKSGIAVWNSGEPTIRACRITHNLQVGVWVYDGGAARIEGCDLSANGRGPVDIATDCIVNQSNNTG